MRRTMTILAIAAALLAFYLWNRTAPPSTAQAASPAPVEPEATAPERMIVLADVTESLRGEEIEATYKLVRDVFRLAPYETEIIVYPITAGSTSQPFEGHVPDAPVPAAERGVREWRVAKEAEALALLKSVGDSARKQHQRNASCISVGVQRAGALLEQAGGGARTDILVFSDMVEDCRISVFGGLVRLDQKDDVKRLTRDVPTLQSPIDLKGARVMTFFPSAATSAGPDRDPLRRIWKSFLQHSKADARSMVDADYRQYFMSIGVGHKEIDAAEREPTRR